MDPDDPPVVKFGQVEVSSSEVFVKTELSFAFVNLKPLVPGHVLVSPLRVTDRYTNLTVAEVYDLSLLVYRVARVIQARHHADGITMAMQDGAAAGQTVRHVHFHVLPRNTGDLSYTSGFFAPSWTMAGGRIHTTLPRSLSDRSLEASELRLWISDDA